MRLIGCARNFASPNKNVTYGKGHITNEGASFSWLPRQDNSYRRTVLSKLAEMILLYHKKPRYRRPVKEA